MHTLKLRALAPEQMADAVAIDDDACELYPTAGVHFDFGHDHPFAQSEYARWARAASAGRAFVAERDGEPALALLVLGFVDGQPYLEQLSVRMSAMRQGIGRWLVQHAIEWAGDAPLWLTTYAHVPWNRPFYERLGFEVVPRTDCAPEIAAILDEQQRWLPAPEHRVAMRRRPR